MKHIHEDNARHVFYRSKNNGEPDDEDNISEPHGMDKRKVETAEGIKHEHSEPVKRQTGTRKKSRVDPFSVGNTSKHKLDKPARAAADDKQCGKSRQNFHCTDPLFLMSSDDAGMAAGKPFVILYYNTNSRRTQYKYTSVADSFISSLSHDVFLYLSDIFISRYCMKRFFMI